MKGITFGTRHSYKDFGMILTSKSIGLPEPKLETVDVPGRDGVLDLTDTITDSVKYKNRKLSFVFTIKGSHTLFLKILEDVSNYLHGCKMRVILDDDPSFYYFGRCTVNDFKTDKRTGTIQIDVDAEPYKNEINSAGQKCLWDSFSFRYGIIHVSEITVNGTKTFNLVNLKKIVSPTFICSAPMSVTFNNKVIQLHVGEQIVYDIRLQEGNNYLTFSGNGTVTIRYEGGSL
ncbi:MAG: hypothetical protein Q4F03_04940 [Eubacteriales bacterium]|nr:hypothetical protein [Eubacteriales bacterium]